MLLANVVHQISGLLSIGLVHCDVRFPNICLHGSKAMLLDLESLTHEPPSRVHHPTSMCFTYPDGTADGAGTAAWQLSLLLYKASQAHAARSSADTDLSQFLD